jgi:hypothetical protein
MLLNWEWTLSERSHNHERFKYGVLELFGEIGGLAGFLLGCGALMMHSYTKHSFDLDVIRKLYLTRTKHREIV